MKPEHKPFEHLFYATKWSLAGLKAAWRYEVAFRIEALLSLLIVPLAFYFGDGPIETVILLMSWILVLMIELLNSAVEAAVDRISTEYHVLSGRAKDLGSAAVFLGNITFAATWLILLWP